MSRFVPLLIALIGASPALASVAGPPVPVVPKQTPFQQAVAFAHRDDPIPPAPTPVSCKNAKGETSTACGVKDGARPPSIPCRRKDGEIVVCAIVGRSPDRIPLPDERGPAHHPGEFARADVGQGPFPPRPGITLITFGMSKAVKMRNETLKMIYAQEAAEQAAADRAAKQAEVDQAVITAAAAPR
ncbi:hypothetical protein HL653_02195 [Sphingomonas sp. AP4-R1]|uniref:hypothetical protein n=1 Tax=Sphingomonas sp. AP4-R1 TaxID=2735134 RepID=UPI001493543F|nr:hypothetical protein [Sphingomonas sp. AP4-R1]QJU56754.1 hypothetical protein HL653_02195 [Sphingomonas sp. AP4-R1]